ncbi:MAG: glutathione synthase [Candidatus Dasytiphilus stammeri]
MIKLGMIMDPINTLNLTKDSSIAIILEAQKRNYEVFYMEIKDLYLYNEIAFARAKKLHIEKDKNPWYYLENELVIKLDELNVIFMRKDPPVNMEFIYSTYILECAEKKGTLIINKPQSLRDYNEKIFITYFPEIIADSLITKNIQQIYNFLRQHRDIILKPLDQMGGFSIFRIKEHDPNIFVIIETVTNYGKRFCMAQVFIPEINQGDKRVLIIDGEIIPYCLARIPRSGETRGNLAAGGHGKVQPLSVKDREIANRISPILQEKGLLFVGLDIIGDKLTEINITSPTCVQEIEREKTISITDRIMNMIEKRLN